MYDATRLLMKAVATGTGSVANPPKGVSAEMGRHALLAAAGGPAGGPRRPAGAAAQ